MAVVLLYTEGLQSYLIYSRLLEKYPDAFSAVVSLPIIPYTQKSRKKNWRLLYKAMRGAPSYALLNFVTLPFFSAVAGLCGNTLRHVAQRNGIPFRRQDRIDPAFLDWLRGRDPDYILNGSSTIIGRDLLQVPRHGVLNYHAAPLPEYRGAANYYWLLKEPPERLHGTLHYVDEGLDTGEIIAGTERVSLPGDATVFECWMALVLAAFPLLDRLMPRLAAGERLPSMAQDHGRGVLRSFPERRDVRQIRRAGHGVLSPADIWSVARIAATGKIPRPDRL